MALNSRQKRARKRKLALALLAHSRNPSTQPVEGAVRSAETRIRLLVPPSGKPRDRKNVSVGRPLNWEGKGVRGKLSGGKVIKPKKPLYRLDGIKTGLIDVDAPTAKRTSPDTLRLKAAKTQLAKRNADD